MPLITHNQITVPSFMYGTAWKKEATTKLVKQAVEAGFAAIDTANQLKHYDEARVGEALQTLISQGVNRDSLFLQTKFTSIDGQDHRLPYDPKANLTTQVKQSMDSSLEHLHIDRLDSYVLHGPYSRYKLGDADWEVWAAIEALYEAGKTRMIGISNVSADQLAELCAGAKVKPMMVQNRCYAITGWDQDVRSICQQHGIIYQGFSLLTANGHVLMDPGVSAIAKRLNTGPAQVIFRFAMHLGMLPLTGTTNARHMKEDLQAERLELSADDIAHVESISAVRR